MYTVSDIQKRYGVSEGTVLLWIRAGDLKAMNAGRSAATKKPRWRITQAAIDAFEQSRTATPAAPRVRRAKPQDVVDFYK